MANHTTGTPAATAADGATAAQGLAARLHRAPPEVLRRLISQAEAANQALRDAARSTPTVVGDPSPRRTAEGVARIAAARTAQAARRQQQPEMYPFPINAGG